MSEHGSASPFVELARADWARLAPTAANPLSAREIDDLRTMGDPLDVAEVEDVYVPLSRLLTLYVAGARTLAAATSAFLGRPPAATPFVIGVAGSVAVGKSTISRLLAALLRRWEETPRVELVTTDGFLLPNAELERRSILHRKGFPESYDRRALLRFVSQVKGGAAEVSAPVYSHATYDIVPDARNTVRRPDVLIIEGLNVLQPAAPGQGLAVSDLFDFSIYVDARTRDIEQWYTERLRGLMSAAITDPRSYFHRFAVAMNDEQIAERARGVWHAVNEPNLVQNILPTRARATLVLRKGADHAVSSVLLRKI